MRTASLQHPVLPREAVHDKPAKKGWETHEPETCFRQTEKWWVGRRHRCLSHANGVRRLWRKGVMFLDWWIVCCSGQSEGAQVG
jgi:hypothetical protein